MPRHVNCKEHIGVFKYGDLEWTEVGPAMAQYRSLSACESRCIATENFTMIAGASDEIRTWEVNYKSIKDEKYP
jgi:hypothetical protein